MGLLGLLLVVIGGYALLLSFLPTRVMQAFLVLSLVLIGFLWTRPRYYLLRGGNDSVVINEEATGRSWTYSKPPFYYGEIDNLGTFAASMLAVGMAMGGAIAYKVRSDRAKKAGE